MNALQFSGIELAPNHKEGLILANPVMPAAGCFGFGPEYAHLVDLDSMGAIVVGPITAAPRRGAYPPRIVPFSSGVLLHTGLANPGVRTVARSHAHFWSHLAVPVIAHVAATTPEETAACCRRLSRVAGVASFELGLRDAITDDEAAALIQAAREAADRPLIVRLPLAQAADLCRVAVSAGADALTVAAPPRGILWHEPSSRFVTGWLYGPFVLPLAIHALRSVADLVSVPLIGCGGVHSSLDAQAFLQAGAAAVQVGGAVWRDPASLTHIARVLAPTRQTG